MLKGENKAGEGGAVSGGLGGEASRRKGGRTLFSERRVFQAVRFAGATDGLALLGRKASCPSGQDMGSKRTLQSPWVKYLLKNVCVCVYIYILFLVVLGLRCCLWAFFSGERDLFFLVVH